MRFVTQGGPVWPFLPLLVHERNFSKVGDPEGASHCRPTETSRPRPFAAALARPEKGPIDGRPNHGFRRDRPSAGSPGSSRSQHSATLPIARMRTARSQTRGSSARRRFTALAPRPTLYAPGINRERRRIDLYHPRSVAAPARSAPPSPPAIASALATHNASLRTRRHRSH